MTLVATIPILILDTQTIGSTGKFFLFLKNKKKRKKRTFFFYFSHGTRCAGEVSGARDNGVCGTGVAYDSMVAGK